MLSPQLRGTPQAENGAAACARRNAITSLRSLCLDCNEVSDFSPLALPLLATLSLSRNRVTRVDACIARLSSLQSLTLDWNAVRELPLAVRALTALRVRVCRVSLAPADRSPRGRGPLTDPADGGLPPGHAVARVRERARRRGGRAVGRATVGEHRGREGTAGWRAPPPSPPHTHTDVAGAGS